MNDFNLQDFLVGFLTGAAKDAPMVGVAGITLAGVAVSSWILILTLLWAIIRVAMVAFEFYHRIKEKHGTSK